MMFKLILCVGSVILVLFAFVTLLPMTTVMLSQASMKLLCRIAIDGQNCIIFQTQPSHELELNYVHIP